MNLTEQHAADLLEFRAIKPRLRQLLTDTLTVMRDQNVLDDLADHCAPNGDPCQCNACRTVRDIRKELATL